MTCLIKIEDLWWKYEASKNWVLRGVNFEINEGEFIGITGPSGAGKTTLCLCMAGIIPNAVRGTIRGNVSIFGKNTRVTPLSKIMENVGVVFQDPDVQFVTMRVIDEVAFVLENQGVSRQEMIARIEKALSIVGVSDLKLKNPLELSGGQKQRVAIASMIARQPRIMILDEPTSDLDPQGKREVFSTLSKLKEKEDLTVILVSHEIEELVKYADRIIFIMEGRIVKEGSPREVFANLTSTNFDGLSLPQVTELYYKLLKVKKLNFHKDGIPLTIEEFLTLFKKKAIKSYRLKNDKSTYTKLGEVMLSLQGVTYKYPDGTEAVKEVNLNIRRGEFLAIIGPNGSGKTTLLKLMIGILKPTKGVVKIFGTDSRELRVSDIAFKVGFIYQNPDHQLFCSTVYEECAYALKNAGLSESQTRVRVERVLKEVGLLEVKDTPPYFLSKGQRQRLAIATVLAMEPEVIVVDEPTTGQDYIQSRYIMEMLKSLNENGKTIVVVTHNMKLVAEYARRVVILVNGRIIADGPVRDIMSDLELLERVSLSPPQITSLMLKLYGIPTLTVDEAFLMLVS